MFWRFWRCLLWSFGEFGGEVLVEMFVVDCLVVAGYLQKLTVPVRWVWRAVAWVYGWIVTYPPTGRKRHVLGARLGPAAERRVRGNEFWAGPGQSPEGSVLSGERGAYFGRTKTTTDGSLECVIGLAGYELMGLILPRVRVRVTEFHWLNIPVHSRRSTS